MYEERGVLGKVLLQHVAVDAQCAVKDAEDIDCSGRFDRVGDSVVPMKKNADVPVRALPVTVA